MPRIGATMQAKNEYNIFISVTGGFLMYGRELQCGIYSTRHKPTLETHASIVGYGCRVKHYIATIHMLSANMAGFDAAA